MPAERARLGASPSKRLYLLLRDAIDVLEGAEPTMDGRGEIHRAIELLNRVIALMWTHDASSYPPGIPRRIAEARHGLNIISRHHKEFGSARDGLKAVLRDWDDFLRAQELEGS